MSSCENIESLSLIQQVLNLHISTTNPPFYNKLERYIKVGVQLRPYVNKYKFFTCMENIEYAHRVHCTDRYIWQVYLPPQFLKEDQVNRTSHIATVYTIGRCSYKGNIILRVNTVSFVDLILYTFSQLTDYIISIYTQAFLWQTCTTCKFFLPFLYYACR